MTARLRTVNTIQMDSKLTKLLTDVQDQVLAEQTRRQQTTENAWILHIEELPLDLSNMSQTEGAYHLEEMTRNNINNGLPSNDRDFATLFAQEYLNDVDFELLAVRHGAIEDIT
jgi:hypothetical protein